MQDEKIVDVSTVWWWTKRSKESQTGGAELDEKRHRWSPLRCSNAWHNIPCIDELTHSDHRIKTRKLCSIPSAYNSRYNCRRACEFRDLYLLVVTNANRCTLATATDILQRYHTRSECFLSQFVLGEEATFYNSKPQFKNQYIIR